MLEPAGPRRRRRRRHPLVRAGLLLAAAAGLFALGVAFGQTLERGPQPEGTVTLVRTLEPLSVAPERETVTVRRPP